MLAPGSVRTTYLTIFIMTIRVFLISSLLQDLDPLWTLPRLTHLSLLDNQVSKEPGYRCALGLPAAGPQCISHNAFHILCLSSIA